jgi:hypothetical protein
MIAMALEVRRSMGKPLDTPHVEPPALGMARTRLGEQLLRIRKRIVESGEPLLSWEEIERDVAECRGEFEPQGR